MFRSLLVTKRTNVGQKKWYANAYAELVESFRLEDNVLKTVLDTRYVKHFYPEEREKLREKWIKRV